MTKPKPGDLLTYTADIERTGVVLDLADAPGFYVYDSKRDEDMWRWAYFAVWVHREDGTFDKVKVVTSGKRAGETTWIERVTAGGRRLPADESFPKSA